MKLASARGALRELNGCREAATRTRRQLVERSRVVGGGQGGTPAKPTKPKVPSIFGIKLSIGGGFGFSFGNKSK